MAGPNAPYTDLDAPQTLQQSFDSTNDAMRVNIVAQAPSGASFVKIEDTAGNALTSTTGSLNVNLTGGTLTVSNESKTFDGAGNPIGSTSGALNVNASNPSVGADGSAIPTSSTLVGFSNPSGNLTPGTLNSSGALLVDASSTSTLPLPTGASTSALQTSGNSSLSTIATNTPTVGQKASTGSTPVVIASDQSSIPVTVTFPTEQNVNVNQLLGAAPSATNSLATQLSNGTTYYDARQIRALTSADVVSVQGGNTTAVKVDGSAVTQPVSATSLPLPTGAATSALQTQISGQLPATLGAHVTTASLAVNIASDQVVPVSATSLPLPTGAATSALQSTANTSLATIATNTALLLVPATFYSGQKSSTGTAIAISTSQSIQNGVIVQALSSNTSSVYVGATGVTTSTGFELQPGQATSIGVNNLSNVFIISITSGDGICYIGS